MPVERFALVISVEHASRDCPPEFDRSGIAPEIFDTHAAWDPGAREVAEAIQRAFGAPIFLGRWTRLFCDLNRSPGSEEAIPSQAFGVEVASNARLTAAERKARLAAHHAPHWDAVRGAVSAALATHEAVLHLSVHSFVERYRGQLREVDLGVLVDPDAPLEGPISRRLVPLLSGRYLARENEPYDGRTDALTTGLRRELPADRYAGVEIEINQRHLGALDPIADLLVSALRALGVK